MKGPLKACEMALRLKTHTAEAAMLFLEKRKEKEQAGQSPPVAVSSSRLFKFKKTEPG